MGVDLAFLFLEILPQIKDVKFQNTMTNRFKQIK